MSMLSTQHAVSTHKFKMVSEVGTLGSQLICMSIPVRLPGEGGIRIEVVFGQILQHRRGR